MIFIDYFWNRLASTQCKEWILFACSSCFLFCWNNERQQDVAKYEIWLLLFSRLDSILIFNWIELSYKQFEIPIFVRWSNSWSDLKNPLCDQDPRKLSETYFTAKRQAIFEQMASRQRSELNFGLSLICIREYSDRMVNIVCRASLYQQH